VLITAFREIIIGGKSLVGFSTCLNNLWKGRFSWIALFLNPIKPVFYIFAASKKAVKYTKKI